MVQLAPSGREANTVEVMGSVHMSGLTACPFCQSPKIRAKLPVHDLHEYACDDCHRSWLVARPKRQARIVLFPTAAMRAKRHASGENG
jgi:transposase-like protein